MNAKIFDLYASEHLRSNYMEAINSMDIFSSYCLTEPGSGSDSKAMKTNARIDGDDFVING